MDWNKRARVGGRLYVIFAIVLYVNIFLINWKIGVGGLLLWLFVWKFPGMCMYFQSEERAIRKIQKHYKKLGRND